MTGVDNSHILDNRKEWEEAAEDVSKNTRLFRRHEDSQSCGFLEGYIMKLRVSTNETPGSFGVFVWIWLVTKYNNRGNNSMKMYTVEYETPVYCS